MAPGCSLNELEVDMYIQLWNFAKRLNSTKTPTEGAMYATEAYLKQAATHHGLFDTMSGVADNSLTSPNFLFHYEGFLHANYVQAWGYYYFIEEIYYGIEDMVEISCTIDVLATYKANILLTTAKVIYSSSYYNLNIDDTRNELTENSVSQMNMSSTTFLPHTKNGLHFLITTLSGTPSGVSGNYGFAVSYGITQGSLNLLISELTSGTFTQALSNFLLTPIDCVVALMATEYNIPNENQTLVCLGSYETDVVGFAQSVNSFNYFDTLVTIPHIYGDYRDGDRCSRYVLDIPYCGVLEITPSLLYDYSQILVRCTVDSNTLDMTCNVIAVNNYGTSSYQERFIDNVYGNCGRQIPIGQIIAPNSAETIGVGSVLGAGVAKVASGFFIDSMAGTASSVGAQAAGTLMAGGGTAVAAGAAGLAGIGLIAGSLAGKKIQAMGTQFHGGYSTMSGKYNTINNNYIELTQYAQTTCDTPTAIAAVGGLPINKTLSLGSLTGYCKCQGASVEIGAPNVVRTMLNNFLNGGFYIE